MALPLASHIVRRRGRAEGISPQPSAYVRHVAFRDALPNGSLVGNWGNPFSKREQGANAADILEVLLEAERCAIRTWSEVCDLTFGKDPRTYDLAARILNEEVEHEAWFIELLSMERDGVSRPSGHFRR